MFDVLIFIMRFVKLTEWLLWESGVVCLKIEGFMIQNIVFVSYWRISMLDQQESSFLLVFKCLRFSSEFYENSYVPHKLVTKIYVKKLIHLIGAKNMFQKQNDSHCNGYLLNCWKNALSKINKCQHQNKCPSLILVSWGPIVSGGCIKIIIKYEMRLDLHDIYIMEPKLKHLCHYTFKTQNMKYSTI